MAKKFAPIPVLPAGNYTGLDILEHVGRLILDEPKRLNMGWWVFVKQGVSVNPITGFVAAYGHPLPACGTVGCFAGWVALSTRSDKGIATSSVEATQVLAGAGFLLRNEDLAEDLRNLYIFAPFAKVGTVRYAKAVASQIKKLAKKHQDYLSTRVIRVRRNGYSVISEGVQ